MIDKLTTEQLQEIQQVLDRKAVCLNTKDVEKMVNEILYHRSGQQWLDMVTKPTEPNPHAALIAQCEEDKVDYPDFWDCLYQWKNSDGEWCSFGKNWIQAQFKSEFEYRQHPHRARIIEFHQCSDEDKKRWQCKGKGKDWENMNVQPAQFFDDIEYRIRPRTCNVTLQNGTVLEYPEPVRVALEIGQGYWLVNLCSLDVSKQQWCGFSYEQDFLNSGSIHLAEQAAHKHLEVLQAVNKQVAL